MNATFLAVVTLYLLTMSRIWSTARTAPVSVAMGKPDKDRVINLRWSADVSTLYPPRYAHALQVGAEPEGVLQVCSFVKEMVCHC